MLCKVLPDGRVLRRGFPHIRGLSFPVVAQELPLAPRDTAIYVAAAGLKAAMYGPEHVSPDADQAKSTRATVARVIHPEGPHKDPNVFLAVCHKA